MKIRLTIVLIVLMLFPYSNVAKALYLRFDSNLKETNLIASNADRIGLFDTIKPLQVRNIKENANCNVVKDDSLLLAYKIKISPYRSLIFPNGAVFGKVYQATSILFPCAGFGDQDVALVNISSPNDAWQKNNAIKIANKQINEVPMLGSHDTGSYAINKNSFLTPDASSGIHTAYNMGFHSKIQGWAITQSFDVATQLLLGVRYLDLRLCGQRYGGSATNENNDIYTCHSLSGAPLKKIVEDVKNFIDTPGHEQEIVLLDIGHLYNVSDEQLSQLTELLRNAFGEKIASYNLNNGLTAKSTYHDFWLHGKQVIILLSDEKYVNKYPDIYWPHSEISSPWPNTIDKMKLLNAMKDNLNERDFDKFFVLQSQETPDTNTIFSGVIPFNSKSANLLQLTGTYKLYVLDWLDKNKTDIQTKGNIILHDFVDGIRTEAP